MTETVEWKKERFGKWERKGRKAWGEVTQRNIWNWKVRRQRTGGEKERKEGGGRREGSVDKKGRKRKQERKRSRKGRRQIEERGEE